MTNIEGEVFQHVEYFPFGETWVEEHSNRQRTPYLFTGKELDEDTQLYYFGARYYDPRTSVWQSPDPILVALMQGRHGGGLFNPSNLNVYSYSHQKPVIMTDPDGNTPLCFAGWPGALACLGIAWATAEVALTAYDVYDVITTISDPDASGRDKALTIGGALLGVVAPGGGYSQADEGVEILAGLRRTFNDNGYRREFYDDAGNATHYRDPMTNEMVTVTDDMVIHADHILPQNRIRNMEGFEDLSRDQQTALLRDPTNFQPLPGSLNCSKGARCGDSPWERYRGEDLDPNYRNWLEGEQTNLDNYFQSRIEAMLE